MAVGRRRPSFLFLVFVGWLFEDDTLNLNGMGLVGAVGEESGR